MKEVTLPFPVPLAPDQQAEHRTGEQEQGWCTLPSRPENGWESEHLGLAGDQVYTLSREKCSSEEF